MNEDFFGTVTMLVGAMILSVINKDASLLLLNFMN